MHKNRMFKVGERIINLDNISKVNSYPGGNVYVYMTGNDHYIDLYGAEGELFLKRLREDFDSGDWQCSYCETKQLETNEICSQCGAPRR